jgi:hypothetical protein
MVPLGLERLAADDRGNHDAAAENGAIDQSDWRSTW